MVVDADEKYECLDSWIENRKKIFLVCGGSIRYLERINEKLATIDIPIVRFSDFNPNPCYESIVKGVKLFQEEECDSILAIGGGSAIDVAKCVKLYSNRTDDGREGAWLKGSNNIVCENIPFMAIPTTAGTGSEATQYAVIYFEGVKQSISNDNIVPDSVILDPSVLKTLPIYQKKVTMCDAFCHAIESYWSINSTDLSKEYSKEAICAILDNKEGYLSNTDDGNAGMLKASYWAGKAINITQTTAGHAMCYKITSMFGLAHGHAAILCNRVLFDWMIHNIHSCVDSRGREYLKQIFDEIGILLGGNDATSGAVKLNSFFESLELEIPFASDEQYVELKNSVNPVRLKNNPCALDEGTIESLYRKILR